MPAEGVSANISMASVPMSTCGAICWGVCRARPSSGMDATRPAAGRPTWSPAASHRTRSPSARAELSVGGRRLHGRRRRLPRRTGLARQPRDAREPTATWNTASPSGAGAAASARACSRLSWPPTRPGRRAAAGRPAGQHPGAGRGGDTSELRGKRLGRVEIDAVNRAASGGQWRRARMAPEQASMSTPEATFNATGNWAALNAQAAPAQPAANTREPRRTVMNFKLDIADSGQLLAHASA